MREPMKDHVPDDWLQQYSAGVLEVPRLAQVEEHLLVCEHCRERLTKLDDAWGLNG
jgi:anti-sigma factor ChrR (cupin superfamily)